MRTTTPLRLGVVGGAGPYASALFYKLLLDQLYQQNRAVGDIIILNYPFAHPPLDADLTAFDAAILQQLQECINRLQVMEVSLAVLICNTLHAHLSLLPPTVPFIHLPKTVQKAVVDQGVHTLLILGTAGTKRDGLYENPQYAALYPSEEEQISVQQVINRVLQGELCPEDAHLLESIVRTYEQQVDGVVLGCTELPVLHARYPLKTLCPLFDSIAILAHHLTKEYL